MLYCCCYCWEKRERKGKMRKNDSDFPPPRVSQIGWKIWMWKKTMLYNGPNRQAIGFFIWCFALPIADFLMNIFHFFSVELFQQSRFGFSINWHSWRSLVGLPTMWRELILNLIRVSSNSADLLSRQFAVNFTFFVVVSCRLCWPTFLYLIWWT